MKAVYLFTSFCGWIATSAEGQPRTLTEVPFKWTDVTERESRRLQPFDRKKAFVQRAPSETSRIFELAQGAELIPASFGIDHHGLADGTLVKLPVCAYQGRLHTFELRNSNIIPADLQEKFPDVRSYHGFEVGGSMTAEITVGPDGIRAQIWVSGGRDNSHTCYVDPHTVGRADKYSIYSHADPRMKGDHEVPKKGLSDAAPKGPGTRRLSTEAARRLKDASFLVVNPPAGKQKMRTYRFCTAVSPDYLTFAQSKGSTAMSMLTATLSRASGIWRRVLSISLQMCSAQDQLFNPPKSNPLPDGNPEAFLDACNQHLEWMGVYPAMYDIAHYISASGGGGLGACCACDDIGYEGGYGGTKCKGGTALENPMGDPFDVDYLAHEVGHQFGHLHTFSGQKGNCGSNWNPDESVELGSGRTVLSYAGICDSDNTQPNSSPYFASVSLGIFARGQNDDSFMWGDMRRCGTLETTTNTRPTATSVASCAIPKRTPFVLKGTGTDPDWDTTLTYNWEQVDSSTKATPLSTENKEGPLFLSVPPSTTGHMRDFPHLKTTIKNHGTTNIDVLERLSSVQRDLHFTMTVRDQYDGPGGYGKDTAIGSFHAAKTTVNVAAAGPLSFTPPFIKGSDIATGGLAMGWRLYNMATDANSRLVAGADYKLEYAKCLSLPTECTSTFGWTDDYGESCLTYDSSEYCTAYGTGTGWGEEWGPMDVMPKEMPIKEKPSTACCACGGGVKMQVCQPGPFVSLSDFTGKSSWRLSDKGFGHAKVNVPASLAGSTGFFRVIAAASSEYMTSDVYCKFYALSHYVSFIAGKAGDISVVKTIPASGATGVGNLGLTLAIDLDRDAELSATAWDKTIIVRNGANVIKWIAGDSPDIVIAGNSVDIVIGDVGAYQVDVVVPADLIESLPQVTISFTTASSVTKVAPTIVSHEPAAFAIEIFMHSTVSLTPSSDAIPGPGSVRVVDIYDNQVLCTVAAKEMTNTNGKLSFVLKDAGCFLYQGYDHEVQVDKDFFINPVGGLTLAQSYAWTFTAWVDTVPPHVTGSLPINGAKNVSEWEAIIIYWNEDVYAAESRRRTNIYIRPRDENKQAMSIPVKDESQCSFSVGDEFTGELALYPTMLQEWGFQPRTTYDVSIQDGAVEDWPGNKAAAYTMHFTVGDSDGPYCGHATSTQASATDPLVVNMDWYDWLGQTEPSQLIRSKSGKFWVVNVANALDTVMVDITDTVNIQISGLTVIIKFAAAHLTAGATYSLRWPDHIMRDDYDNPVFKWSHSYNDWCNMTRFTVKSAEGQVTETTVTTTTVTTTTGTTTPGTTTTTMEVKVAFTMKMKNVDYEKVKANTAMVNSIVTAVKDGVLAVIGSDYTKDDLEVALSAGSVVASILITPKAGTTAAGLVSGFTESAATAIQSGVLRNVFVLEDMGTMMEEGKTILDISLSSTDPSVAVAGTEPAPTEPAPTEPAPTEPAPTEPAPTQPAPTESAPTQPAPTTVPVTTTTEAGFVSVPLIDNDSVVVYRGVLDATVGCSLSIMSALLSLLGLSFAF